MSLLLAFSAAAQDAETPHDLFQRAKAFGLNPLTIKKVEALLASAIPGFEKIDPANPELADAIMLQGMIRQSRAIDDIEQLRTDVEPFYRKALDIYDHSVVPADRLQVALALELEASVLQATGQFLDATPLLDRASGIRKEHIREMQKGEPRISAAFKPGEGIRAPRVIAKSAPGYSEVARFVKQQGTVLFRFVVDEAGLPRDLVLVHSVGFGLDEKAFETLRTWRFQPGTNGNGDPVAVIMNIEMNFRLL